MVKISKVEVKKYSQKLKSVMNEMSKAVIGNEDVMKAVLRAMLCGGHVLIEGPTGVGKTLLVKTLHKVVKGSIFQRIQFTVDMLPSDITGGEIYVKRKGIFEVQKGPVFTNLLLADEINRAPPKVQSALLQAMEEKEVTIGKKTFKLPSPFLVFATQNPLEQHGVFSLPEAQVDRFLFNIKVGYLEREKEKLLMENNIEIKTLDDFGIKEVIDLKDILRMQQLTKKIELPDEVKEYSIDIVNATRYPEKYKYEGYQYIRWGGSPRAVIWLNFSARANAFLEGRTITEIKDVREVAKDVLRHRIILTYEGTTLNVDKDEIIESILKEIPTVG